MKSFVATAMFAAGIALAVSAPVQAQVSPVVTPDGRMGLGTLAPDNSAILDLTSTSHGFLMTRMTLAQRNAISSPATSLLLFNTTTSNFEYYGGSKWDTVLTTANSNNLVWLLKGNNGTNPANDFLGTIDAVDLVFRTNNTERMRVASAGNVGIGTGSPAASALLDLSSNSRGFLVPRMTTADRNAIAGPASSLLIFNTTDNAYQYWDGVGGIWQTLQTAGLSWLLTGNPGTTPWNGAAGNFLGTTDAADLVVATIQNQSMQFWTNNTERMRLLNSGNLGINEVAPSARLDVVEAGAQDAIEATANTGIAVHGTKGGGSGLILGSVPAIHGDAAGQTGVAGTSSTGVGVFGASNANHGVNGLGVLAGTAGVFGRNDAAGGFGVLGSSVGSGTAVQGNSQAGISGRFENTSAANASTTLEVSNVGTGSAATVDINNVANTSDVMVVTTNGTGHGVLARKGAGSGINPNGEPAVWGDAVGDYGVAGTGDTQPGVFGRSNSNHGIFGSSATAAFAGVFGRNDVAGGYGVLGSSVGPATGVLGASTAGIAGRFENTTGGNASTTLEVENQGTGNATTIDINNAGNAADALVVTTNGTGNAIVANGGAIDGNAAGNELGDGTAVTQLSINGVQDATGAETLPNAAFDLAVTGDIGASGIIKSGAGIWLDGVSATHSLTADQPMDVNTVGVNNLTLSTNSTTAVTVDGTTQDVTVANGLNVGGVLDAQAAGNLIGDGTDAEQLQIDGVDGGAVDVDVNGDMDISGNLAVGSLTMNGDLDMNDNDIFDIDELRGNSTTGDLNVNTTNTGDINLGNGSGDVNVNADVIPSADNTHSLGTDANRWADVYVNGGTVHLGPTGGEAGNTEMALGYAANVGSINVNGTGTAQIEIDAAASTTRFDPDGDGTLTAFVRNDGIGVNTGVGTDILIAQDGIQRNGNPTETFAFTNTGGVLDVNITGSLDVDTDLNVDGNATHVGTLDQQGAVSNSTGDVVVNDDANVTGSLDVDTDFNVDGNATHVGTLDQQGAVSNSTGDVVVNDDANVTGSLDVDTDLNVDGTTTLVGAFDAQAAGNLIGDGLDAEQLQIDGVDGGAVEVDVNGDMDVSGTLTAGTISLGLTQGSVTFADAGGSLAEDNTNFFWDDANNRLGIGNNAPSVALDVTGNIEATGTIQSGASIIIDGTTPGSHNISTTGAEDLTIAPGGGDLAVTGNTNVTGSLDVDTDLNIDGNATHVGTLDQQGAVSNSTGDVVVNDDANVTGSLDVDTDFNVDGNATHVGTLDQQGAVSNSTGDVVVNDDANVTGSLDVDTDFNVDGNATHVGTLDQQGAVSNSTGDVVISDATDITGALTLGDDATPTPGTVSFHDNTAANTFTGTLQTVPALTANRTYTLPDADGTLALVGGIVTDATLTGDGSSGNPLGIDLTNANSWTATQTFSAIVNTGTLDQQGAVSNSTGDVVVNDDANVTGSLDVDTDFNVDGNATHVGTLDQQGAVSNSTGDVVVNDDANVTGSLDVDTDFNVDGNATLSALAGGGNQALYVDNAGTVQASNATAAQNAAGIYSGAVTVAAPNAGGTEAVADVNVAANSVIVITRISGAGAQLSHHISAVNAGVGFTVQFSAPVSAGDVINYMIINP